MLVLCLLLCRFYFVLFLLGFFVNILVYKERNGFREVEGFFRVI